MAKQSSGEAGKPVIIALVCFVLLSLGLGVFAYTATDTAAQAKADAKKAADDKSAAEKTLQKAKDELKLYKVLVGTASPEEKNELQSANKSELQDAYTKMMSAINARAGIAIKAETDKMPGQRLPLETNDLYRWDWPAGGDLAPAPTKSLLDQAVANYAQRVAYERQWRAAEEKYKQDAKMMNDLSNKLDQLAQEYNKQLSNVPSEIAKGIEKVRTDFEQFKENFNKTAAEQRDRTTKYEQQNNQLALDKRRADQKVAGLQQNYDRMLEATEAIVDPHQFDRPQGRIIRRYQDNLVDIDLGLSDRVRAGLTFAVFPSDTPSRGMQSRMRQMKEADGRVVQRPVPKGRIEVIEVLGPNLAQCRITDEESQIRDRILAGDLLYNAVWKKGAAEHVALFGIFDLNGDGRDDIQSLVRDLGRVGVVVDAYYDLAQMKWVGEFTDQTVFAVRGYTPTQTAADGNADAKAKIRAAIEQAERDARDRGVRILRPRDFFPRIGYSARMDVSQDVINQAATAYVRQFSGDATAQPQPGSEEKKEPEKKEPMGK